MDQHWHASQNEDRHPGYEGPAPSSSTVLHDIWHPAVTSYTITYTINAYEPSAIPPSRAHNFPLFMHQSTTAAYPPQFPPPLPYASRLLLPANAYDLQHSSPAYHGHMPPAVHSHPSPYYPPHPHPYNIPHYQHVHCGYDDQIPDRQLCAHQLSPSPIPFSVHDQSFMPQRLLPLQRSVLGNFPPPLCYPGSSLPTNVSHHQGLLNASGESAVNLHNNFREQHASVDGLQSQPPVQATSWAEYWAGDGGEPVRLTGPFDGSPTPPRQSQNLASQIPITATPIPMGTGPLSSLNSQCLATAYVLVHLYCNVSNTSGQSSDCPLRQGLARWKGGGAGGLDRPQELSCFLLVAGESLPCIFRHARPSAHYRSAYSGAFAALSPSDEALLGFINPYLANPSAFARNLEQEARSCRPQR